MKIERNLNYDLMRLLGLVIIMVAHASPPAWLFQLRNFGTPLLVLGSGLTYALIFSKRKMDLKSFYAKRVKKLVIPVWFFLSFFFVFSYVVYSLGGGVELFSFREIVGSYALVGGIGFVWVFKIYLFLALITPFVLFYNKVIVSNIVYFSSIVLLYFLYELTYFSSREYLVGVVADFVDAFVFTLVPYALIYLYAFRLPFLNKRHVLFVAFLSLSVFLFMLCYKYVDTGLFVATQNFKYPPTLYYLSYAFFCVNILYLFVSGLIIPDGGFSRVLVWLSTNSLWIYLWHIFAFYVWKYLFPEPAGSFVLFAVKATFLFVVGIVLCIIQNRVVANVSAKSCFFKQNLSPLLSGMS
ncbi:MAG: hypothetical protein CMD81_01565 [Gammaproteobacteria bacterium]|nr:hypothetical protein [Gammaproteobacteria bacterium]